MYGQFPFDCKPVGIPFGSWLSGNKQYDHILLDLEGSLLCKNLRGNYMINFQERKDVMQWEIFSL